MAKSKSKKVGLSEKIQNKRKSVGSSIKSPFEVHINKQKLKVLGRKTKHDKGFPGLSRSKAIDKRKKTLLEELKVRNKSNVFKDRRIAEHDPNLTVEEKQMARFAAIRQKVHKKKSIFNLGDDDNSLYTDGDDILTHKGQALSEIEKFEDPRSDDEMDNEDDGKLDKNFVEQVHFGGGFLKTTNQDGAKSHKDILEQIIAESKKRKAEKKQTKDELNDLTEKLDAEWKDFVPLAQGKIGDIPRVDEFGKKKNKMKFEIRSLITDPIKSEEEIAKIEQERIEKLEKERLERMMPVDEDDSNNYRSVDDLDLNCVYESLSEDEKDNEDKQNASIENGHSENEIEEHGDEQEEEENGSNSDDNDSENESSDDLADLKADTSESENEEQDTDSKGETDDDLADLKAETSESEDEKQDFQHKKLYKSQVNTVQIETEEENELIQSTFDFPEDDEKLQSLLRGHSAKNQGLIIQRITKCHDASLSEGNKEKLGLLFKYMLQYLNDISLEATEEKLLKSVFSVFDVFAPHLFDLAQLNQKSCQDAVREVIKEKFQDYIVKSKQYPELDILFFLKIVGFLFPTSDFKHCVVTPCFVFIEKMLMCCRVQTRKDISYGLFLSCLVLEYTTLSKRLMPGCLNFLSGIIHMAVPKCTVRIIKVVPPFKSMSSDLVLLDDSSSKDLQLKMEVADLVETEITESFKVRALHTAVRLIIEFFQNYKEYPSSIEIFEATYQYCKLINPDMYPNDVKKEIKTFIDMFEDSVNNRKLEYLKMEAAKPKILRLYEPNIVEIYDRKTHKVQSKAKAERSKLLHKLKREKKGALREIRRDNAFLGRVKISKQIESDKERKEKVKRIYAEANVQQSELNAIDRKKKKK